MPGCQGIEAFGGPINLAAKSDGLKQLGTVQSACGLLQGSGSLGLKYPPLFQKGGGIFRLTA
jgi:hypothetical protein